MKGNVQGLGEKRKGEGSDGESEKKRKECGLMMREGEKDEENSDVMFGRD